MFQQPHADVEQQGHAIYQSVGGKAFMHWVQMAARETGIGAVETYMHAGKLLALELLVKVLENQSHSWSHVRPEVLTQCQILILVFWPLHRQSARSHSGCCIEVCCGCNWHSPIISAFSVDPEAFPESSAAWQGRIAPLHDCRKMYLPDVHKEDCPQLGLGIHLVLHVC